jgi:signal transduction histidine kinase
MSARVQLRALHARVLNWFAEASRPLLVAVAYYLGAEAAFLVGTLSDKVFAPFWPPNVILFCALVFVPYRRWWLYIAFSFPAHVIAELGVGMTWPPLIVAFATNCSVAAMNAFGVRYLLGEPPWFDNFRKAISYVMLTAVASPAIVAFGGAFVRSDGIGDLDNYWTFWAQWYAGNALVFLSVGPVLLAWFGDRPKRWWELALNEHLAEGTLLAMGLVLTSIVAFKVGAWAVRGLLPAILYLPLPLLLWAAVRFGARGASAAILAVTVVSIWLTLNGAAIFVDADAERSVLALQLFLAGLAVPILVLGATMDGLRRAELMTSSLARFVIGTQDQERRQVARELHDRVAQDLVAALWTSTSIRSKVSKVDQPAVKQIEDALRQSVQDLRTVSYFLHPPMLDDSGLAVALRGLVDDWSQRNGIVTTLDVSDTLGRHSPDVELTMFRLVEDALANISSGSATARVSVDQSQSPSEILMTVEDAGKGMSGARGLRGLVRATKPNTALRGIGLARMRERISRLEGKLEIESSIGKTTIRASIPVADPKVPVSRC